MVTRGSSVGTEEGGRLALGEKLTSRIMGRYLIPACLYRLLHSDRDFDPFAKHLGLRIVV
jgi:hypothetical protein